MEYATLALRFAAIVIDTVVLFFLLVVVFAILAATGAMDLRDPMFSGGFDLNRTAPVWVYAATYGLVFVYYTLLEALTAASVGKLVLRMRVTMDDGSRPTGVAIVIRNLVRLPEVLFWYVPSGISCVANSRNKRLGDIAGRTVVLHHSTAPIALAGPGAPVGPGRAQPGPEATPLPPAAPTDLTPHAAAPRIPASAEGSAPSPTARPASRPELGLHEALAALKTAALAARGAHLNYLRFSEIELSKNSGGVAAGLEPAEDPAGSTESAPAGYSPEYEAAWYTLTDAVAFLQQAHAAAIAASVRGGTTLQGACADQPDLSYLFEELRPYFTAGSDEQVHDAYMQVARGETTRDQPRRG
jgi:uncharacterized RDD family membrane protein YckC